MIRPCSDISNSEYFDLTSLPPELIAKILAMTNDRVALSVCKLFYKLNEMICSFTLESWVNEKKFDYFSIDTTTEKEPIVRVQQIFRLVITLKLNCNVNFDAHSPLDLGPVMQRIQDHALICFCQGSYPVTGKIDVEDVTDQNEVEESESYTDDAEFLEIAKVSEYRGWMHTNSKFYAKEASVIFDDIDLHLLIPEIKLFVNITELAFENAGLYLISPEIGQLTNLKYLTLSGNSLTFLPKTLSQLTRLETLDLNENTFEAIPEFFQSLTRLDYLDFSNNLLSEFPESANLPVSLVQLFLHDNRLEKLSSSIGELTNLTTLNLGDYSEGIKDVQNVLTELPESMVHLTKLTRLKLSYNKLAKIPKWIGNLTNLIELELHANHLEKVTKQIGKLCNLIHLNLAHQKPKFPLGQYFSGITKLPETMSLLTNLRGLHLTGNNLEHLPLSMVPLVNQLGNRLEIEGNPLIFRRQLEWYKG